MRPILILLLWRFSFARSRACPISRPTCCGYRSPRFCTSPGSGLPRASSSRRMPCGARSFFLSPFLFPFLWIMNGGQLAAIGFFAFALALREEDRGHFVRSGLALSLCLYKPSLLLLFLPMLVISRRYRTLAGFFAGGIALILFTVAVEGVTVWSGYLGLLFSFGSAAASTHGYRILRYYMDLASFSSLLPGGRSLAGGAILLGCAGWASFPLSGLG